MIVPTRAKNNKVDNYLYHPKDKVHHRCAFDVVDNDDDDPSPCVSAQLAN